MIFWFLFFICWGSFLNVVAYRLTVSGNLLLGRSLCPLCEHILGIFDLVPILSWLFLQGRCRYCHGPISLLYPAIELLTAVLLTALVYSFPADYAFTYFLFVSGLIVTIRSDLETMLISRLVTIALIPVGLTASFFNFLPITVLDSSLGALFALAFLWIIGRAFYYVKGKEGIGQGDIDLLACIGSFLGVMGALVSIGVASCIGAFFGIGCILLSSTINVQSRIPFGPFIVLGALYYLFFQDSIITFLVGF